MKFTCSNENKIQQVIEYLNRLNPYETYYVSIERFNERYSNTIGLLTTDEAREYLDISLSYVNYLVRERQLNPIKVKSRNYFDPADLDRFKQKMKSGVSKRVQSSILN